MNPMKSSKIIGFWWVPWHATRIPKECLWMRTGNTAPGQFFRAFSTGLSSAEAAEGGAKHDQTRLVLG